MAERNTGLMAQMKAEAAVESAERRQKDMEMHILPPIKQAMSKGETSARLPYRGGYVGPSSRQVRGPALAEVKAFLEPEGFRVEVITEHHLVYGHASEVMISWEEKDNA